MLWKKESTRKNSVYVDLFASINDPWSNSGSSLHKRDDVSLRMREEGNALFAQKQVSLAMDKYNDSLRYATPKDISLIYANRSTCFLKMQLYNECLKDIELAKEAGYPKEKMKKLDDRKAECLEGIENGRDVMFDTLKMSLEPDEKYPCMANVLEFKQNTNDYPSIVAKEDIDVGQVIMEEKLLFPYMCEKQQCAVCLKGRKNFIPCKRCTLVWFCSKECENSEANVHEYECGLKFSHEIMDYLIISAIRRIAVAIEMFSNVDELMSFVEESIKGDPKEIPAEIKDVKSQYRAFLKFPVGQPFSPTAKTAGLAYRMFKVISGIPKIKAAFSTKKYQRFLMHLFVLHFMASNMNFYSFAVTMAMAYIDYACTPNVIVHLNGGTVFVTAFRPIEKGDHLLLFPELHRIAQSKEERRASVRTYKEMTCECTRCMGFSIPTVLMRMDPIYETIQKSVRTILRSHQQINAIIENCFAFLRKYGHMMWCKPIEDVIMTFVTFTDHRMGMPYERSTGNLVVIKI